MVSQMADLENSIHNRLSDAARSFVSRFGVESALLYSLDFTFGSNTFFSNDDVCVWAEDSFETPLNLSLQWLTNSSSWIGHDLDDVLLPISGKWLNGMRLVSGGHHKWAVEVPLFVGVSIHS